MASRRPTLRDGDFTFREVTWDDCRRLYDWRMHEQSRMMFRHTEVVPYPEHEALLKRYLSQPGSEGWFIFEDAGVPVGSIGYSDFLGDGTVCELGRLTVNPELRSKGYASRGVRLTLEQARAEGFRRVHVEIYALNVPCLQLFYTLRFVEKGRRMDGERTFIYLEGELP